MFIDYQVHEHKLLYFLLKNGEFYKKQENAVTITQVQVLYY